MAVLTATVAGTVGQSLADWITPTQANLASVNLAYATWDTTKVTQGEIRGTNHSTGVPAGYKAVSVDVIVDYDDGGSTMAFPSPGLEIALTLDGTTAATAWQEMIFNSTGPIQETVTFTVNYSRSIVNATSFGYLIRRNAEPTASRLIDRVQMQVTTATGGGGGGGSFVLNPRGKLQVMDMLSVEHGGYEVCRKPDGSAWEHAMASVTASTKVFANAPDDCEMVQITVRTAGITLRYFGTATTSNGHDFAADAGQPYVFYGRPDELRNIEAIATTGTPTGWISYMRKRR